MLSQRAHRTPATHLLFVLLRFAAPVKRLIIYTETFNSDSNGSMTKIRCKFISVALLKAGVLDGKHRNRDVESNSAASA